MPNYSLKQVMELYRIPKDMLLSAIANGVLEVNSNNDIKYNAKMIAYLENHKIFKEKFNGVRFRKVKIINGGILYYNKSDKLFYAVRPDMTFLANLTEEIGINYLETYCGKDYAHAYKQQTIPTHLTYAEIETILMFLDNVSHRKIVRKLKYTLMLADKHQSQKRKENHRASQQKKRTAVYVEDEFLEMMD